jgi:hypothetical protein
MPGVAQKPSDTTTAAEVARRMLSSKCNGSASSAVHESSNDAELKPLPSSPSSPYVGVLAPATLPRRMVDPLIPRTARLATLSPNQSISVACDCVASPFFSPHSHD